MIEDKSNERLFFQLSETREVIKALREGGGEADLYELHMRYQLSPGQLRRVVRVLTSVGIIEESEGGRIAVTPFGRNWLVTHRAILLSSSRYWRDVPIKYARREGRNWRPSIRLRMRDVRVLRKLTNG